MGADFTIGATGRAATTGAEAAYGRLETRPYWRLAYPERGNP